MKKTLVLALAACIALAPFVKADDLTTTWVASSINSSTANGGEYSGIHFILNSTTTATDRLTITSDPVDATIAPVVGLTSIEITARSGHAFSGDWHLVVLNSANKVVAVSSENSYTGGNGGTFTATFTDAQLITGNEYKAVFQTSAQTAEIGSTMPTNSNYTNAQYVAWGSGELAESGASALGFLAKNNLNSGASSTYVPEVTIRFKNVPEPATATLSLLALAGLAARRRRK